MKKYQGTFGKAYGNWGAVQFNNGLIISFESRHYPDGVVIRQISKSELEDQVNSGSLMARDSIGYNDERMNQFILSRPNNGNYRFLDGKFIPENRPS